MPNENQPQEFETFQLLFEKDLPTSESPMAPFKSFIEREQSFVNQILDYMHAPGKEGFFPHSFLGNAVSLLSTKLNAEKINAKKICYRFDGAKTLKLVVATSKDGKKIDYIYPFIFTEDIKEHHVGQAYTDKFEFTKSEISSVIDIIKKDKNLSTQTLQDVHKNKFTLIEVLKNNYTLEMKRDEPKDIKLGKIYVYKKGNALLFKAKDILNKEVINEIPIGKEKDKLNIDLSNFTNAINGKDTRGPLKFKIKSFLSRKGFLCKKNNDDPQELQADGLSATENNVTVRVYKKDFTNKQSTKVFKEITYRLEPGIIKRDFGNTEVYIYLEDYIDKLATAENFRIKDIFEKILAYVQQAHSGLRVDKSAYGSGAREANQHAFLAGIFQMDRYRDNTRIFIEQLAGRGLADTILLPLGFNRVSDSIPIVIEHKAKNKDAPSVALSQSKEYAKGLPTNRIRFLTSAEQALCTGINLDYKLSLIKNLFTIVSVSVKKESDAKKEIDKYGVDENYEKRLLEIIKQCGNNNKRETKEKILSVLTFNSEVVDSGTYKIRPILEDVLNKIHERTESFNEIQKYVKEQLERTYYAFPGTRYGRNNHCFSQFLLGYTSNIDDSKYKKYAFVCDESSIIKTDSREKKYNDTRTKDESHAVTAIVFVPQEVNNKVVIMNLIEGDDKAHKQFNQRKLAKNALEKLNFGSKKIVEINLFFDIKKKGPESKFTDFFKGFENERKIVEHNNLDAYVGNHNIFFNGDFGKISVPEDFQEETEKLLANPSIHKDFFKQIGKIIFPFKDLIKNEYDFQAVLDGIFGAYSDKNKSVVLTEYQTGLGNRIDMIIHQKGKPIIGLELKIAEILNANGKLEEAIKQIEEKYKKTVTYKVLEDIGPECNKAELISVVFVRNASSADELIKCSENTITAEIKRSSVAVIPQRGENSTPIVLQASGSKRLRESLGTTQSESKRPTSADDKKELEHPEEPMEVEVTTATPTALTQDLTASNLGSQPSTSGGGKPRNAPYLPPGTENMYFSQGLMNKRQ